MTLQIAIEARDGFVLASDTRSRSAKDFTGISRPPDSWTHESKIRISDRHQLAVGVAGRIKPGSDPAQRFVDYIARYKQVPEEIYDIAKEWGEAYQKDSETEVFSLLIVNPRSNHPIWKVRVASRMDEEKCSVVPHVTSFHYAGYQFNGKDDNGAVVWPLYFRCGNIPLPPLGEAKNIAALTILMGSEFCLDDLGGLEIRTYRDSWTTANADEINAIGGRFAQLKNAIDSFRYADPSNSPKLQT